MAPLQAQAYSPTINVNTESRSPYYLIDPFCAVHTTTQQTEQQQRPVQTMAVLSTLQNYADSLLEQLNLVQSSPIMEQIRTYKWSIFGGTVAAYALYKYLSRPR